MKKYIELTEYDSNGRIVIFVDSIQGLYRVHDYDYRKDFTEVMISGYTFIVNESIDEILEKMESDQGHLDGIDVLDKIRTEIYQLHCHPKLDFIKTDEVVDMALEIIDKYR